MTDYADRLRKFNRAGQVQYEWFNEVADYIDELELTVEALEQDRTASYRDGYEAGLKTIQDYIKSKS